MDISPQRVRTAEFKTAKRGLDPDEVREFLNDVASELERAQNQSTAMEARARAAVARLQELSEGSAVAAAAPRAEAPNVVSVTPSVDESETISRTLLLAQRTADTTVAEARAEAERIAQGANDEASRTLDSTREMSARLLEEAREEARRVGDEERLNVEAAVNSLLARRDFLESDVDHLERHLADERSRLREAATTLLELTEKVPGGMGEVRRPLLSAAADGDDTVETDDSDATIESDDTVDPDDAAITLETTAPVDIESSAFAPAAADLADFDDDDDDDDDDEIEYIDPDDTGGFELRLDTDS